MLYVFNEVRAPTFCVPGDVLILTCFQPGVEAIPIPVPVQLHQGDLAFVFKDETRYPLLGLKVGSKSRPYLLWHPNIRAWARHRLSDPWPLQGAPHFIARHKSVRPEDCPGALEIFGGFLPRSDVTPAPTRASSSRQPQLLEHPTSSAISSSSPPPDLSSSAPPSSPSDPKHSRVIVALDAMFAQEVVPSHRAPSSSSQPRAVQHHPDLAERQSKKRVRVPDEDVLDLTYDADDPKGKKRARLDDLEVIDLTSDVEEDEDGSDDEEEWLGIQWPSDHEE